MWPDRVVVAAAPPLAHEIARGLQLVDDACTARSVIGEATEVVGFRSGTTANRIVDSDAPVGDLTARRNAIYVHQVHDAIDAAPWADDDGFAAVAVALPTADRLLPHAGAPAENGTP